MLVKQLTIINLIIILCSISAAPAHANKVVVVPIGSGSELRPIAPDDVLVKRLFFTQTSDIRPLFTTNANTSYVLTSMHVYFRGAYPSVRRSVAIRTRTASTLGEAWYVPNDTYSVIDFGSGYLLESSSTRNWQIDVFNRGGYGTGFGNAIYVDFYGYRVKK